MDLTQESIEYLRGSHKLSSDILSSFACKDGMALREKPSKYDADVIRTNFAIDIDNIIHSALYNRGSDKTQVFSFFRNDDITRRSLHMQYVSRIGRVIGKALRLNCDLIEAIAIGHDVGHTPFGHKGEEFLCELYHEKTGRYFNHNVHSVRVLQYITPCNLSLQTLDGILCHNGEKVFEHYAPHKLSNFIDFNEKVEQCYTDKNAVKQLHPSTLEGCVVRISDIIAYIGKDRQDAAKAKLGTLGELNAQPKDLGNSNTDIITNIIIDIINNSTNKDYIAMSNEVFAALQRTSVDNFKYIYQCDEVAQPYYAVIKPMMQLMYDRFLDDLEKNNFESLVYKHYLNGSIVGNYYRHPHKRYVDLGTHNANDIVTDFIASMTDDYFIDAFRHLFPRNELNGSLRYFEYFDTRYL